MTRPLTILEQAILVSLRSEPRTPGEIGDAIGEASTSTVVDLMRPLSDDGLLVWRDGDPGNSRFGLTPAGAAYLTGHGVEVGSWEVPR